MTKSKKKRVGALSEKFIALLCALSLCFTMAVPSTAALAAVGGSDGSSGFVAAQFDGGAISTQAEESSDGSSVEKTSISTATIAAIDAQLYTGSAIEPAVTVTLGDKTLVKDTDYTVAYTNNVDPGYGRVTVTGVGSYEGTRTANFSIYSTDISKATVSVNDQPYTGKEITPKPAVRFGGYSLVEGTDFKVEYADNVEIGTAKMTITGTGTFTGTVEKTFGIIPFFTLYTKANADAKAEVAGDPYKTETDFMELQQADADPVSGMMFQWTVLTADEYVTLADIFSEAGITVGPEDRVTYTGRDNWSQSLTWGELCGNFYPNAVNGHTEAEAKDAYEVPAILAMNYVSTAVNPEKGIANAKAAEEANIKELAEGASAAPDAKVGDNTTPRLIHGVAEQNFTDANSWNHWGWTSGSIIGSITVTDTKSITDASIEVKDAYETGEAVEPEIIVKDGDKTLVKGTDYTVRATNNTEVSTADSKASVTISGIGNYTGSVIKEFSVLKVDSLSAAKIAAIDAQLYTGSAIEPAVTVTLGDKTLVKDTDYTVAYTNNTDLGTATVTVKGINGYSGTLSARFAIYTTDLSKATISVNSQPYTGEAVEPTITVRSGGLTLKLDTDYTDVKYENNVKIGTAKVSATGMGAYTGTVEGTFEIVPFFTLYTKTNSTADPVVAKQYNTYEDFARLMDDDAEPTSGMMFQWTVLTANKYVKIDDILADADVTADPEDRVTYTGRDDWSQNLTWGELCGNFYPNAVNGHTEAETKDAYEVPAILAMNYVTESVDPEKGIANAKAAEEANIKKLAEGASAAPDAKVGDNTTPRLIHGVAEQNFTDANSWNHWGWTMGSIIKSITITDTKSIADARISVNDVSYTGEAVDPDVTVRDGQTTLVKGTDYTVRATNNTEISTDDSKASVTISGIGNYTGSVTKEFSVKPFFTLYTKANSSADPVIAKQYKTYDEFAKLMEDDADPVSGQMFQWTVLTADKYVKVADILADADVSTPGAEDRVIYGARDNWSNSLTWGELNGKFYPNAVNGHTAEEAKDAYDTPLILAMNYVTTSVNPDKGIADSAAAEKSNIATLEAGGSAAADSKVGDTTTPRLIHGVAEQNFTDANSWNHWGWTMGSVINSLTIVDTNAIAGATVDAIAAQEYTGESLTPDVRVTKDGKELVKGTDYTVRYSNNVNPGTATVTISGANDYTGTVTAEFTITAIDASKMTVADIASQTYTGEAIQPAPSVTYGEKELVADTDYTVAYADNVKPGQATITLTGINGFSGTTSVNFDITRDISTATISDIATQDYTASAIEPEITVTLDDEALVADTDYAVLYSGNVKPGTANIVVLGKGFYTGSVSSEFTISDDAAKAEAAKAVEAINAIGTVSSSADAEKVAAAEQAYSALSTAALEYVPADSVAALRDAQSKLAEVTTKEAADKAAADQKAADEETAAEEKAEIEQKAAEEKAAIEQKAAEEKAASDKAVADANAKAEKAVEEATKATAAAEAASAASTSTANTITSSTSSDSTGLEKGEEETVGSGSSAATVEATGSNEVAYVAPAKKSTKKVVVPATVKVNGKTYKVTSIQSNAFKGSSATSVKVGKNVKTIGKAAFKGCNNLQNVSLGKNVKTLGKNAFQGCKKLTSVTFGSNATKSSASSSASSSSSSKSAASKNKVKGSSVQNIGAGALAGATNLTEVKLGNSVKSVGAGAFKGCTNLTTLKVSSTKLTQKACQTMLQGSSVQTVKLVGMSTAQKEQSLAKYQQWFPSSVSVG